MKKATALILSFLLLIGLVSCKKKDNEESNISSELASSPQVYTYTPSVAAEPLSDEEMFAKIDQLEDMLKSVSSSGCSATTLKNIKEYGQLLQSHRYSEGPLSKLMGYSGDIVMGVLNYRYRIYRPTDIYNAYSAYLTEFESLDEKYATYTPLTRLTLNQAMMTAFLVGDRDYNTSANTFAGSISFTPTKSGVTFDKVWASVGKYVGYPLENMQSVFFSDYKTMVATNTIITDAKLEKVADTAYYATSEYVDVFKNQTIDYVFCETSHILDYGEDGKRLTEELFINNQIQNVNSLTICKHASYDAVSTIISANFEGKEDDPAFLPSVGAMTTTYNNEGEFVIAYVHFGESSDDDYKKKVARYLCENGAGIVIGIGEGEIEGVEFYNGKYIFYNIAPLINGSNTDLSVDKGLAVQIILRKGVDRTVLENLIVIPFTVNSNLDEEWNNFQPTPIFEEELDATINDILSKSSEYEYGATSLNYFKTTP